MIAYLRGRITFKSPTYIVMEVGGVGYGLYISLYTYAMLEKLEEAKVLTHLQVKEDSHTLYGFMEAAERNLFRQLISVSGVGPATAQVLLSTMNPGEVRAAILGEQVAAFHAVKGIGPKTAKRIILDLKDKLLREGGEEDASIVPAADNTLREEALSALIALGFNKAQVQKALNRALKENPSIRQVETLIKVVLKQLS